MYRIDRYLGKESVQNLLAFRFGNAWFESACNRDHITSVQITVSEELGIEGHAGRDQFPHSAGRSVPLHR